MKTTSHALIQGTGALGDIFVSCEISTTADNPVHSVIAHRIRRSIFNEIGQVSKLDWKRMRSLIKQVAREKRRARQQLRGAASARIPPAVPPADHD